MQIFQEQKPVQQQRPQMYAAVEILQLDVCQLQSYVNTALLENPTLECGAAPGVSLLDDLSAGGHAAAGNAAAPILVTLDGIVILSALEQ